MRNFQLTLPKVSSRTRRSFELDNFCHFLVFSKPKIPGLQPARRGTFSAMPQVRAGRLQRLLRQFPQEQAARRPERGDLPAQGDSIMGGSGAASVHVPRRGLHITGRII